MANPKRNENHALLAALSHPQRRRILRAMPDGEELVSPRELAEQLDQPLTHLSYHVRVLVHCGAIKLVNTKKIRGATQHFYRSTVEAEWAKAVLSEPEKKPPSDPK